MRDKSLEQSVRDIVRFCYCHYGEERCKNNLRLIRGSTEGKEIERLFKIAFNQIRKIDKRFDDMWKDWQEMVYNKKNNIEEK